MKWARHGILATTTAEKPWPPVCVRFVAVAISPNLSEIELRRDFSRSVGFVTPIRNTFFPEPRFDGIPSVSKNCSKNGRAKCAIDPFDYKDSTYFSSDFRTHGTGLSRALFLLSIARLGGRSVSSLISMHPKSQTTVT